MMRNQFIRENIAVISIFLFFLVVVTFFSISAEAFFSKRNILNLLRQSAPVLIAACAMTFVITTKGIDLSIGSTLAIINALCAVLLQQQWDWTLVFISLLVLGMFLGGIQGYFVAYEGIIKCVMKHSLHAPSYIIRLGIVKLFQKLGKERK